MRRCNYKNGTRRIGFNYYGVSLNNVVVREATPVDQFYFEESVSADDGNKCVAFCDPIRMLFNQQRLNNLGAMAVENWLNAMKNTKNDPLAELRKKCSDADLLQMIKSRHIQQPSEVMAWVQYTQSNMAQFEAEVASILQAREVEEQAKNSAQKVEVPPKTE